MSVLWVPPKGLPAPMLPASEDMRAWIRRRRGECQVCGQDLDVGCRCDDRGIETERDLEREP